MPQVSVQAHAEIGDTIPICEAKSGHVPDFFPCEPRGLSAASFLSTGRAHPAWNMAVDEALLHCAQEKAQLQFIARVYGWDRPSLSLGYFQRTATALKMTEGDSSPWTLVRRPTGGGIVRHTSDWTYSLIYPENTLTADNDYQCIHRLIKNALEKILQWPGMGELPQELGHRGRILQCFAQPSAFDLMRDGQKIAGAARKRSKGWILHQGSVELGKSFSPRISEELTAAFIGSLQELLHQQIAPRDLTAEEINRAKDLCISRYDTPAWNNKF